MVIFENGVNHYDANSPWSRSGHTMASKDLVSGLVLVETHRGRTYDSRINASPA